MCDFLLVLQHPGGMDVLLEYAGRDASIAFRSVNHGPQALDLLKDHVVGQLPVAERIFTRK
jgi:cytochrome b5